MASIKQIRETLRQQRIQTGGAEGVFQFWEIPLSKPVRVRFLPDIDGDNPLFWIDVWRWPITFRGSIDNPDTPVRVITDSLRTFGQQDPLMVRLRPYWRNRTADTEPLARLFSARAYRYMYGFVRTRGNNIPLPEDTTEPYVIFRFTRALMKVIDLAVANEGPLPDDADVTDFETGHDFVIIRQLQGEFNTYAGSYFDPRPSSLSGEEIAILEEHGLRSLKDDIARVTMPTKEEYDAVVEMFDTAISGGLYDPERWGHLKWQPVEVTTERDLAVVSQFLTPTASVAAPSLPGARAVPSATKPRISPLSGVGRATPVTGDEERASDEKTASSLIERLRQVAKKPPARKIEEEDEEEDKQRIVAGKSPRAVPKMEPEPREDDEDEVDFPEEEDDEEPVVTTRKARRRTVVSAVSVEDGEDEEETPEPAYATRMTKTAAKGRTHVQNMDQARELFERLSRRAKPRPPSDE